MTCDRRSTADFHSPATCAGMQRVMPIPLRFCVVSPADCSACLLHAERDNEVVARLAIDAAAKLGLRVPETSPPRTPCIHLGPLIAVEACDLCGFKGQPVEVFGCTLHGRCTAIKMQRDTKSCASCQDWQPEP